MQTTLTHTQQLAAVGALASAFFSSSGLAQSQADALAQSSLPDYRAAAVQVEVGSPIAIRSASEFIDRWSPTEPLYVKGTVGTPAELNAFRNWISEHNKSTGTHWSVILVEKAAGYEYARGKNGIAHGAEGYLSELRERFVSQPQFKSLQDPKTGEHNGALLFISLDNDGENRKMLLWTGDAYESRGVGSGSDTFLKEIFPVATRDIRNGESVSDAAKYVIGTLDAAKQGAITEASLNWVPWVVGGVAVVGIVGLITYAAVRSERNDRRYGYSSGSSSSSGSSFFWFSDGGGGVSCGGGSDSGGGFDGGGGGDF